MISLARQDQQVQRSRRGYVELFESIEQSFGVDLALLQSSRISIQELSQRIDGLRSIKSRTHSIDVAFNKLRRAFRM